MLILCVYIDSDRWISGIEPILYPSGLSFYRSFSYRQKYFEPVQLAEQLRDRRQREALLTDDTLLGLRFKAPDKPELQKLFIPLRRVNLTTCETADNLDLGFRLGAFVLPHKDPSTGDPHLPTLDLQGVLQDIAETKLFIQLKREESETAKGWHFQDAPPDEFWSALENTLPQEVISRLHGAVVLMLLSVQDRKSPTALAAEEIDTARRVWGFRLKQGNTYDIALRYHRILQHGTSSQPSEHHFCLSNRPEEVQCSRRTIHVIGNYRREQIWINPLVATAAQMLLSFEPCTLGDHSQVVDATVSQTVGLNIPTLIKSRFWSWARIVNLVLAVLSLLASVTFFLKYSEVGESVQKLLIVVIAATVSVFVTAIKDFILPKS